MNPTADSAAQDLAKRPRFSGATHERVERIFRRFVVDGANAEIAFLRESRELRLSSSVGEVGNDGREAKIRSSLANPVGRELRLHATDRRVREEVPMDVLRRIDVRLDQSHASHGRIANEKVEDDHPAATGADLE